MATTMNNQYQYQYQQYQQYQMPYQYQNQAPYQYQASYQYQMPYQYQSGPAPSPVSSAPIMDVKKDQKKEIREAIDACDNVLKHLRSAKKYLNSANKWGILDIAGGGFLSSAFKQGNMCDARRELNLSNDAIKKLQEELKDVEVDSLKTGNLLDFTDIFVDNLFSDILVQTKIADAKNKCKKAIFDVEKVKKELENRLQKL